MEEKITIYKRKKNEIIESLIEKNFQQMKDKFIQDKIDKKNSNGYDYLVKISLYSFTEEEIEKLNKEKDKVNKEYNELNEKSIEKLWSEECDLFLEEYKKQNKIN